jgi:hypothetical protein
MRIRWSVGILLGFALGSCADPEPTKSSSAEGTAAKYLTTEELEKKIAAGNDNEAKPSSPADYTFGFETRDHQLWLHTGTDPQLYTVKAKDGKVVADAIDCERLALDYPELHELLRDEGNLIDIIDY